MSISLSSPCRPGWDITIRFIMNMKRLLTILLIPLICNVSAAAEHYSGKEIFLFGNSPASLGRAATGAASEGIDFFYSNPASIGDIERTGFSLMYGSPPLPTGYHDAGGYLALPTSYGVFGAAFRYMQFRDGKDITGGYSITVGNARDIFHRLAIGFSLSFFHGRGKGNYYYTGGTLGFIYSFPGTGTRYGFCVREPRLGLSVHFGYPFGSNRTHSDLNEVALGYQFVFFSVRNFKLSFYNEYTVLNYREFPIKIGLEGEIVGRVLVRAGYVISHAYNDGSFTTGLGVKFDGNGIGGSIDYSMNISRRLKLLHYLGATFMIGNPDREPPVTEIETEREFISPTNDGMKDYCVFTLSVHDRNRIKGWTLQILDSSGQVVKDYSMKEREVGDRISAGEFFKRLFYRKESLDVPARIIWDGTNNDGQTVPDGSYEYLFKAWDERDNMTAGKTGRIFVDTTPPEVRLEKAADLFSPNRDGRKDFYIINQRIKTGPDDEWMAEFRNREGVAVKSYRWEGHGAPSRVVWDGTDDTGNDVPEGLYSYVITGVDRAGNSAVSEIREITLTRAYEIADITLSSEYFSFNHDASINLFPVLSRTSGLTEWRVTIMNGRMKSVREISENGSLPKVLTFDGTDADGSRLKDGIYYARLSAVFSSGNTPESQPKRIIIDSTPPKLKISHVPRSFSPDGDNEDDLMRITPRAKDLSGVREWSIKIYSSSGDIFKSFWGTGDVPREILWDGLGDAYDVVESASEYKMVLEATDRAGNSGQSSPDRIEIDVLAMVNERGIRIRVSGIEFQSGGDDLRLGSILILNRVHDILQRYGEYDVIIEGHTDDVGREEDNLELSERHARAVYEYLAGKGLRRERFSYVGMGETVPLYPNTTDENRRRNRRIEFSLVRNVPE